VGQRIGRYILTHSLAEGGMAEVFVGVMQGSEGFSRPVAIKRLPELLSLDSRYVQMFIDEAKLCARLSHPNIVAVLELCESDGEYAIIMELVDGADLGSVLRAMRKQKIALPQHMSAHICGEALRGLHYAHEARGEDGRPLEIVHRDISPSNILLSMSGAVKVTDFGIAKAVTQSTRTATGALKGKLAYMSPEQATGKPLDRRSDVFALGIVLHELLAGKPLYDATNQNKLLNQAQRAEIAPLPSSVDPSLRSVVQKALARKPDERFETCEAFAQALARATRDMTRVEMGHVASLMRACAPQRAPQPLRSDATLADHDTAPSNRDQDTLPVVRTSALRHQSKRAFVVLTIAAVCLLSAVAWAVIASNVSKRKSFTAPPVATSSPASLPIPLPEAPKEPAPGSFDSTSNGFLTINARPWANVYLDGSKQPMPTPLKRYPLSVGWHSVRVESPGTGWSEQYEIRVRPNETITKIVKPATK
jgi:serine/threonine protein kinase